MGDRLADLELMEFDLRELYKSQLIEIKDFQVAMMLLRREIEIEKEKKV